MCCRHNLFLLRCRENLFQILTTRIFGAVASGNRSKTTGGWMTIRTRPKAVGSGLPSIKCRTGFATNRGRGFCALRPLLATKSRTRNHLNSQTFAWISMQNLMVTFLESLIAWGSSLSFSRSDTSQRMTCESGLVAADHTIWRFPTSSSGYNQ